MLVFGGHTMFTGYLDTLCVPISPPTRVRDGVNSTRKRPDELRFGRGTDMHPKTNPPSLNAIKLRG